MVTLVEGVLASRVPAEYTCCEFDPGGSAMYRALFCCCLLLPHLATAIDTDARVLVFPSLKNPGTHPSTLQSLYRSIVLDLNSFRHFKIASISSTEIEGLDFPPQGAQAQHIWN